MTFCDPSALYCTVKYCEYCYTMKYKKDLSVFTQSEVKSFNDTCPVCGVKMVEALDEGGKWSGHSFRFPCDCGDKDLRISVG